MINASLTYLIEPGARLFEVLYRGFKFNNKPAFRLATKRRYIEHANKCYHRAHYDVEKFFKKHDPLVNEWSIRIVGKPTLAEFEMGKVNFKVVVLSRGDESDGN